MKYGIETIEYRNGEIQRLLITSVELYPRSFIKGNYGLPNLSVEWFGSRVEAEDYLKTGKLHRTPAKCCGECRYHKCIGGDWICTSKESEFSGDYTEYNDYCDKGEAR